MVDEKVSEAVGAQPVCERVDVSIVFARMTDEKYRHCRSFRTGASLTAFRKCDQDYALDPRNAASEGAEELGLAGPVPSARSQIPDPS
jgi:hypothetical protein